MIATVQCNCDIGGAANRMLEVFTDHYGKLQSSTSKNLSGHFVTERIIDIEEDLSIQQKAQTVGQSQAAASIVLNKIENSLKAGQTSSFNNLLIIMEKYGGLACEELAKEMRGKLSIAHNN